MKRVLCREVKFVDALFGKSVNEAVKSMKVGEILMLENTRFYSEETEISASDIEAMESSHIVRNLEPLMDYYVIDAFPAIHRAQTTLVGFRRVKPNIAGRLIEKEITMLDRFSVGKEHPKLAILAGSKIDDSIAVSKNFLDKGIEPGILQHEDFTHFHRFHGFIDAFSEQRIHEFYLPAQDALHVGGMFFEAGEVFLSWPALVSYYDNS